MQRQQTAEHLGARFIQPGSPGRRLQFMGVFLVQQFQQLSPGRVRHLQRIQKPRHKTHVAYFQHGGHFQRRKALEGQVHHLGLGVGIHRTHALQPHLVDGLEGVAFPAGTADFFIIIKALALPCPGLRRFGNGQRYVRLDGPQFAVQVCEGNHLGVRQKTLVFLVEGVFLKAGTAVFAVPCLFVQRAQPESGLLRRGKIVQLDFHIYDPCLSHINSLYFRAVKL